MSAGTSNCNVDPMVSLGAPTCSHANPGCELKSFCASHIAALSILACSLVLFVIDVAHGSTIDHLFGIQTALLMTIVILWYFFGALNIEEKYIHELRNMQPRWARSEITIRIGLFVCLELSEVLPSSSRLRPEGVPQTVFTLTLLYAITVGFMCWDIIVDNGEQTEIAWTFFGYDALLAGCIFFCLVAAVFKNQGLFATSLFVAGLSMGIVVHKSWAVVGNIARRLFSRKTLR